jgi:ubiquinone/menaquinone biosynthesis C-methylase UbiE
MPGNAGSIVLYNCDIKKMPLLPDGIFDGVVSLSALEHNDHDDLDKCLEEILRVTKQAGRIFITVSASQGEDWFHEPSQGWCYSEASIKKYFQLPDDVKTNFSQKDILLEKLKKEGNPLHQRLAPAYFKSGTNGMPWGRWNPQYQPLGIAKVKT